MTPRTLAAGLMLGLLLPASAFAQDSFPGQYTLKGKQARRSTQVDLVVRKLGGGGIVVSRTAKFTSNRYKSRPAFTWTASQVKVIGRRLEVTYIVTAPGAAADADGLIAGLDPDRATNREVLDALGTENRFKALYFLSRNKKSIREVMLNTTRLGAQKWWRTALTQGKRKLVRPPAALSHAAFLKIAHKKMTDWYLADTEGTYEYLLAEATTAAERKKVLENKKIDMSPDAIEFVDDEYWMEDITYHYESDDMPYLDAHGKVVPLANVEVIAVSMYPEHAGIGLSKSFAFDNRTGEILEEGDIQD